MINGILLLWILWKLDAPTWCFVLDVILMVVKFIDYSIDLYTHK